MPTDVVDHAQSFRVRRVPRYGVDAPRQCRRAHDKAGFMDSFEMSVPIERALDEVFSFISDLGNDPSWRREWVDAKRDLQEPIDLGTTTVLYGQALGRRIEAVYEVSEYVPNRTVRWKTVTGPLPLTFWRSVDGAGPGTRVTMGYSADFRGVLRFLRPLLTSAGKRALRKDLPTLKRLLEASF